MVPNGLIDQGVYILMVYVLTHLGYSRTGLVSEKRKYVTFSIFIYIYNIIWETDVLILAVFASALVGLDARTAMRSDICFVREAICESIDFIDRWGLTS